MSILSQIIQEESKIPFAGLAPHDGNVEIPRVVADAVDLPRVPEKSLKDVIEALPCAERRTVEINNSFVAGNGIVNTDDVRGVIESDKSLGGQLAKFSGETDGLFDVGRQSPTQRAADARAIVDPRREALAALGYNIPYHWQIGSSEYTIVNPTEWYYKCYQTLEKHGKREPIGWVEYSDFGGAVDMYVLLPSERFIPPEAASDDNGGDERKPVYLGYNSGYRFDGDRALDFELFGFDTEHKTVYWGLGQDKSQPHRGNVMQYAGEWWESGFEKIQRATSVDGSLLGAVDEASRLNIDFTDDDDWDPIDFVTGLGLPPTYAEDIVDRAKQMAGEPDIISIWNFYINLNAVIDEKYSTEEKSRNSLTFQGYARTGRKLLRDPQTEINRARRKYEEETGDDTDSAQRTLGESLDSVDSIVQDESELDALEKMHVTEQVQKSLGESI